jgi:hypothetical protein
MSPRKRQRLKVAHRLLTWDDCDISDQLDFFSGWHPPRNEVERGRSRWQTWDAYLTAWSVVRAEALPAWEATRAEQLAAARAIVATRQVEVWRGGARGSELLASAEARLEGLEAEALPFAERAYQRVLAGGAPEDNGGDA